MKCVLQSAKNGQSRGDRVVLGSDGVGRGIKSAARCRGGFTLLEVVMAVTIVALVFAGTLQAYIQTGQRLEWTGYSLAAQSLAVQTVEQARATLWDPAQTPQVDEVTNLSLLGWHISTYTNTYTCTGYTTNILDVPYSGTNYIMATNYVTIVLTNLPSNNNVQYQVVTVQTVWPFFIRANNLYFTNTVSTILSPDNRAPSTF